MANRLADYRFTDYSGQLLDTPERISAFLTQWAARNPGYRYVESPEGTAFVGTPTSMQQPAQRLPGGGAPVAGRSGADSFAEYFFAGRPDLYQSPQSISRAFAEDPTLGPLAVDYITKTAAGERAKDKGNIFTKAAKTIGTAVSAATGLHGLTAGLGALTTGAGVVNAVKTGAAAAANFPKQLGASFFPTGASANAVPGIATGVTTPSGGAALIGSGQAAPMSGVIGGGAAGAATNAAVAAAAPTAASRVAGAAGKALGVPGASSGNSLIDGAISVAPDLIGALASPVVAGGGGFDDALLAARNAEMQRQGQRAAGVTSAESAFANQDDYYKRLRSSIYDYHKAPLDEELGNQGRELKFELARRGHLGGSQEVDASAEMERAYRKGLLRASDLAEGAVATTRSADQAAKAAAIRDINADIDASSSIGNAIAQSQLAAQQATDYARGQNLGDVFTSVAYLYDQGQRKRQQQQAVGDYRRRSSGVGPASSFGGSTGRS